MRLLTVFMVIAIAMCASASVFGGTIFFDDFERGAIGGGEPRQALEAITNDQPDIGVWTVTGNQTVYGYMGEWNPEGGGLPDSHVFGGRKYGLTIRDAVNVNGGTFCNLNATFAEQSDASDLVRFEADIWGQDLDAALKLAFLSGETELNDITLVSGAIYVGGVATNLTYALNQWHHIAMDYSPTSATFDLTINDQTQTGLATTASSVDGLRFVQTSVYQTRWSVFDNVQVSVAPVPEPSTLALLACGLIGLLACVWKNR